MTLITCDFNLAPLGAFTSAHKHLVWDGCPFMTSLFDADPNGAFTAIVPNGPNGENVCQMLYPKGSFGMGNQYYQVKIGSPADLVTVNYKIRLRGPGGSDLASGPFKFAPSIQWGPVQSGPTTGTRAMIIGSSSNAWPKPRNFVLQDQHTGGQWVQPPKATQNMVLDQWDDVTISMKGGAGGSVSFKIIGANGVTAYAQANVGNSVLTDAVMIDFAHFAGGGAAVNRNNDVFAEMTNPTIVIGTVPAQLSISQATISLH